MRDPLLVTDVRMLEASPAEVRRGLLGFITCTLGGRILLDGLTLRRSRAGRLYVSFPRPRDAYGRERAVVRPLNASAQREIEAQTFLALGIHPRALP